MLPFLPPDVLPGLPRASRRSAAAGPFYRRAEAELRVLDRLERGEAEPSAYNALAYLDLLSEELRSPEGKSRAQLLDTAEAAIFLWRALSQRSDIDRLLKYHSAWARAFHAMERTLMGLMEDHPQLLLPIFTRTGIAAFPRQVVDIPTAQGGARTATLRPFVLVVQDEPDGPLTVKVDPYSPPKLRREIVPAGQRSATFSLLVWPPRKDPEGYVRWLQKAPGMPALDDVLREAYSLRGSPRWEFQAATTLERTLNPEAWAKQAAEGPGRSVWDRRIDGEIRALRSYNEAQNGGMTEHDLAYLAAQLLLRDLEPSPEDQQRGIMGDDRSGSDPDVHFALQLATHLLHSGGLPGGPLSLSRILLSRAQHVAEKEIPELKPKKEIKYRPLGEADADDIWDYTLNPAYITRDLKNALKGAKKRLGTRPGLEWLREAKVGDGLRSVAADLLERRAEHNQEVVKRQTAHAERAAGRLERIAIRLQYEQAVASTYLQGDPLLPQVTEAQDAAKKAVKAAERALRPVQLPPVPTVEQVVEHYLTRSDLVEEDKEVRDAIAQVLESPGAGEKPRPEVRSGVVPTRRALDDRRTAIKAHLAEIDAWRAGDKATPGQPATGANYALRMRENIAHHAQALRALGYPVDNQGEWSPPASPGAAFEALVGAPAPLFIATAVFRSRPPEIDDAVAIASPGLRPQPKVPAWMVEVRVPITSDAQAARLGRRLWADTIPRTKLHYSIPQIHDLPLYLYSAGELYPIGLAIAARTTP